MRKAALLFAIGWMLAAHARSEPSSSPLATNAVSVSVAGYFTTNINGRASVRATFKMTNQSSDSIWTDGFPPMYEEQVLEAGRWKLRPIQWGFTPRRELQPGTSLEFSVPVEEADPPKRLMLSFHRHPSIASKEVTFTVYSPPIEIPKKP